MVVLRFHIAVPIRTVEFLSLIMLVREDSQHGLLASIAQ